MAVCAEAGVEIPALKSNLYTSLPLPFLVKKEVPDAFFPSTGKYVGLVIPVSKSVQVVPASVEVLLEDIWPALHAPSLLTIIRFPLPVMEKTWQKPLKTVADVVVHVNPLSLLSNNPLPVAELANNLVPLLITAQMPAEAGKPRQARCLLLWQSPLASRLPQ